MFELHIRKNEENKSEVEKFVLFNGKIIQNQGKETDFKWLKTHVAHRVVVFEEGQMNYEATFFYAEFDGIQLVVELGDFYPIQANSYELKIV